MSLISNLEAVRRREKLSNRAFARRLGIQHTVWFRACSNDTFASQALAKAVMREFPELEQDVINYLLRDKNYTTEAIA